MLAVAHRLICDELQHPLIVSYKFNKIWIFKYFEEGGEGISKIKKN